MALLFIDERVNIYKLPAVDNRAAEVTIGDLHGNAIKLLFMLIKHGIASGITREEYGTLVNIYLTPTNALTSEDLHRFDALLNKIVFDKNRTVRLLGDELADRGRNDYFTLKILEKMHAQAVPFEIMLSNHGVEFVEAYERDLDFHAQLLDREAHAPSMERLQLLIDRGLTSKANVRDLAKKAYFPQLRAIAYTLDLARKTPKITIHSHAGIGLNHIRALAEKLGLTYDDSNAPLLAQTIDQINEQFQTHVQNKTIHTLYTPEKMLAGYAGRDASLDDAPFEFIMWNRRYDDLERPRRHCGYRINFVHGHDQGEQTHGHIFNLDNDLGKGDTFYKGNYTSLLSLKPLPSPIVQSTVAQPHTESSLPTSRPTPKPSSDKMPVNMMILSGFITSIGITAVAIAFALLNLTTLGTAGIVVASVGFATTLAGVGLFSYSVNTKHTDATPDTMMPSMT